MPEISLIPGTHNRTKIKKAYATHRLKPIYNRVRSFTKPSVAMYDHDAKVTCNPALMLSHVTEAWKLANNRFAHELPPDFCESYCSYGDVIQEMRKDSVASRPDGNDVLCACALRDPATAHGFDTWRTPELQALLVEHWHLIAMVHRVDHFG